MKTKNIMIVGVGGQGSLLASKLLGHLLMEQGYDVKVSEVHGMSQRGGSVVTYVRYGDRVNSPVIDKGEADYIVSFELLEAARWLSYLKPDGQIVTSTQQIDPMPVITGAAQYPENLVEKMQAKGIQVGDIVTQINGIGVRQTSDVSAIISEYEVGDIMTFTIFRDGETLYVDVELVETSDIY